MPRTVLDDKPIELQLSSLSLISRMTPNNLLALYSNKLIVYLREFILKSNNQKQVLSTIVSILSVIMANDTEMRDIEIKRFKGLSASDFTEAKIDRHLYFTFRPFKEPSLKMVTQAAEILKMPLEEHIYYPDANNVVTKVKAPVGYINIRFLNQIISKGVAQSHKVNEVNSNTNLLTNGAKVGQFSPDESLSMFSYGLEKEILPEFFNMRGDNTEARLSMEEQILEKGSVSLKNVSSTNVGQVQKTLDAYLIGACLQSNLQVDTTVKVDGKFQDAR